jgi:YHS domain-containing protein
MATAIDPVCKMEVGTGNPPGGQSEHEGTDYYFCAPRCKVVFDKEPGKYLEAAGSEDHHGHDHGPAIKFPEKKPGFFSRMFGKK